MKIIKKILLTLFCIILFIICGIIIYNIYVYFSMKHEETYSLSSIDIQQAKKEINHIGEDKSTEAYLLLHGYGGSPYDMKQLTEELIRNGENVFVPCIAGHCGKTPVDLSTTTYQDWLESSHYHFNELQKQGYTDIHIIGFSMGGLLAIDLGNNETSISDITLISPFTEVSYQWYYGLKPSQWNNFFSIFIPYVRKFSVGKINDSVQHKNYIPSYLNLSTKSVSELDNLSNSQWENFTGADFPKTFFLYSMDDHVSSPDKLLEYGNKYFSRPGDKRIILTKSNHIVLHDFDSKYIIEEIIDFTQKNYTE